MSSFPYTWLPYDIIFLFGIKQKFMEEDIINVFLF